jgi:uncharacterized protein YcbX
MLAMASVARFNTTIVKSTSLVHPDEVLITETGIDGDRRYLILHADGRRLSGAQKAPLLPLRVTADPGDGSLSFRFPDGSMSASAGVEPDGDPFLVKMHDRTIAVRRVPHQAVDHDLSEGLGKELMLVRVEDDQNARDVTAVTMISHATVNDLGLRAGPRWSLGMPDPRRFRMTIELDGCAPLEEDSWGGHQIQVGEVVLRVGGSVPRCVVTTLDPDTGTKDFPTLDVLATYRRRDGELMLGVYADVQRPGRVRVGDAVSVLD